MYPFKLLLSCVCVERQLTVIIRDNKADPICLSTKTDNIFKDCNCLRNQIRNDISCELSDGRLFISNINVYFLPEIHKYTVQFVLIGEVRADCFA